MQLFCLVKKKMSPPFELLKSGMKENFYRIIINDQTGGYSSCLLTIENTYVDNKQRMSFQITSV